MTTSTWIAALAIGGRLAWEVTRGQQPPPIGLGPVGVATWIAVREDERRRWTTVALVGGLVGLTGVAG